MNGTSDFVCFLLAEEDKRHPTRYSFWFQAITVYEHSLSSIEYWFRCVDLDGDGQISLYEMEYFYEAIEQKLLAKVVSLERINLTTQISRTWKPWHFGMLSAM